MKKGTFSDGHSESMTPHVKGNWCWCARKSLNVHFDSQLLHSLNMKAGYCIERINLFYLLLLTFDDIHHKLSNKNCLNREIVCENFWFFVYLLRDYIAFVQAIYQPLSRSLSGSYSISVTNLYIFFIMKIEFDWNLW